MIAAAGARFPGQSAPAAAPSKRERHWTREVFFFRSPDLRDEVRGQIGAARGVWEELSSSLWRQERKGRSEEVRSAARRGVLMEVGIHGLARFTGRHPTTVARHLARLEELQLVRVHRQPTRLTRDENGKIVGSAGREYCAVIEVTVTPEHLRPFGARREGGRGRLSARSATPSRVFPQTPTGSGEKTNSSIAPEPPPRTPALGAGSVPADGGKAAASPPPERRLLSARSVCAGAAVDLVIVPGTTEEDRHRLQLRCSCGHVSTLPTSEVRKHSGISPGKCRQCGVIVRFPSEQRVHEAMTFLDRITENVRRADQIMEGMKASTGSMEGGQPVGIAGPAVSVSPSSRGPEPEPEPSSPGRARSVASDARCPSTVPDAGGAADRAAAGTPEGDDEADALERIVEERRRQDAALGYDVSPAFNRELVRQITGPLTTRS